MRTLLVLVILSVIFINKCGDDVEQIKNDGGKEIAKNTVIFGFAFIDGFIEGFTEAWNDPERKRKNKERLKKMEEQNKNLMQKMDEQVRKANEIELKKVQKHIEDDEKRWEEIQKKRKENLN